VVEHAGKTLDLAPPGGFVDICSKAPRECDALAEQYPASVRTVAYFWRSTDWERRHLGERAGVYLIAQVSQRPSGSFAEIKRTLISAGGDVPDNSRNVEFMGKVKKTNLGVLMQSGDAIAIGALLEGRPEYPELPRQVSINMAVLKLDQVLILYVHHKYADESDLAAAKKVAATWVDCIREAP
jgi:hypothetical protein